MKKLIITTKQLSRIDEENNVNVAVNTNGNTVSDAINAVTRQNLILQRLEMSETLFFTSLTWQVKVVPTTTK